MNCQQFCVTTHNHTQIYRREHTNNKCFWATLELTRSQLVGYSLNIFEILSLYNHSWSLRKQNIDNTTNKKQAFKFYSPVMKASYPFKLLEDVNRWDYMDFPILWVEEMGIHKDMLSLVVKTKSKSGLPLVLAIFQFYGSNFLSEAYRLMKAKCFSNDDQIIKMKLHLDRNYSSSSFQVIVCVLKPSPLLNNH